MDHHISHGAIDCSNSEPRPGCDNWTETFFSSPEFATAWSRSTNNVHRPLAIPVKGSGPPRTMYTIQSYDRYWSRVLPVTRMDFYTSPGWVGELERSTLEGILRNITTLRTRSFVWYVRFDHEPLALGLSSLGLLSERSSARVLYLQDGYERVFSGYSATIRKHVKRAHRKGVTIRQTFDPIDIHTYYHLYTRLVEQKGWTDVFPVELSLELVKVPRLTRFVVAEFEGKIVGGGLFVRDGCSVSGIHIALDHDYSHHYPVCAVYDDAIRWACDSGAAFYNFGGSGRSASLETFKAYWGTQRVFNWRFDWKSPLWARASSLKTGLRRKLNVIAYK